MGSWLKSNLSLIHGILHNKFSQPPTYSLPLQLDPVASLLPPTRISSCVRVSLAKDNNCLKPYVILFAGREGKRKWEMEKDAEAGTLLATQVEAERTLPGNV